ncbi:MAG: hypothetical protein FCKEOINB_02958 [Nitrosomonas sp.]|nr:hypothetical protein [Nitrosomonas sp.]
MAGFAGSVRLLEFYLQKIQCVVIKQQMVKDFQGIDH